MNLNHRIVNRINRRRKLAPLWKSIIVFACIFAGAGLLTAVAYAAASQVHEPTEPPSWATAR